MFKFPRTPAEEAVVSCLVEIAQRISGWWFGTWLLFSHVLGIIIPIDSYFSEGLKPPTRYPRHQIDPNWYWPSYMLKYQHETMIFVTIHIQHLQKLVSDGSLWLSASHCSSIWVVSSLKRLQLRNPGNGPQGWLGTWRDEKILVHAKAYHCCGADRSVRLRINWITWLPLWKRLIVNYHMLITINHRWLLLLRSSSFIHDFQRLIWWSLLQVFLVKLQRQESILWSEQQGAAMPDPVSIKSSDVMAYII